MSQHEHVHAAELSPERVNPSNGWDRGFDPERFILDSAGDLLAAFGRTRIEETAFPVYTNRLKPARWLGFARVVLAQRYARLVGPVGVSVDFGSGLGVALPGLGARSERVYAVDRDPEVTRFMVDRLQLPNVTVVTDISDIAEPIDLLISLDVFEHIPDLATTVDQLAAKTRPGGSWIVSGPTENRLYQLARKMTRTTGEGHVRGVDRVFEIVSSRLREQRSAGLPLPLPQPLTLFQVGLFSKAA